MIEQKWKGYQGIGVSEAFECQNTRIDFKYCCYWEKWKTIQTSGIPGTQGAFSDKVTTDIEESVVQYDAQVIKNTFIADFK